MSEKTRLYLKVGCKKEKRPFMGDNSLWSIMFIFNETADMKPLTTATTIIITQ